ncbi:MAG: hypothetical protein AAGJ83_16210 [Planctomycetota bacterium]
MKFLSPVAFAIVLTTLLGCDVTGNRGAANRLAERRSASEEGESQIKKMSIAEVKRAVAELQDILPYVIDEDLTLARLTADFNGSVTFWYRTSDELTVKFRQIGWERFKDQAQALIEGFEFDYDEMPPRLAKLIQQDSISLQFIFEDRYESHLGSFSINDSAIAGEEREGHTQENPFAIRNVSAAGK